jgi:hypothetical protein
MSDVVDEEIDPVRKALEAEQTGGEIVTVARGFQAHKSAHQRRRQCVT